MKKNIVWILLIVAGLVGGYFLGKGDTETVTVEVPIKIEVPVPVIVSDTVWRDSLIPIPKVNPVNDRLLSEYDRLNDSLKKREAYIESIKKRSYKEVFEDSIQDITVFANTTGFLDSLGVAYKTHPRTIPLDTVAKVEIKIPKRRDISLYLETDAIMIPSQPTFKLGVDITTKNNIIFGTSLDTRSIMDEGKLKPWLKVGKKWNF